MVDEHGYCTMGAGAEATRAAAECADVVVAEINSRMPRCYGDTCSHESSREGGLCGPRSSSL